MQYTVYLYLETALHVSDGTATSDDCVFFLSSVCWRTGIIIVVVVVVVAVVVAAAAVVVVVVEIGFRTSRSRCT
jgi:hypothetical protein